MIYEIFSLDTFRFSVTVKQGGAAKDITGATCVVLATNGTATAVATVNLASAAQGVIGVAFAAGALTEGTWEIQVRVTLNGETQTVKRLFVRADEAVMAA